MDAQREQSSIINGIYCTSLFLLMDVACGLSLRRFRAIPQKLQHAATTFYFHALGPPRLIEHRALPAPKSSPLRLPSATPSTIIDHRIIVLVHPLWRSITVLCTDKN